MADDRVIAAGPVIHEAGCHHQWGGFDIPFEEMDSIARSEFLGIVERALRAADAADVQRNSTGL